MDPSETSVWKALRTPEKGNYGSSHVVLERCLTPVTPQWTVMHDLSRLVGPVQKATIIKSPLTFDVKAMSSVIPNTWDHVL